VRGQVVCQPDDGDSGDGFDLPDRCVRGVERLVRVPFVTPIAKFFGAMFVRQDQQTMIEQAEGLR
jgi:hypothetical protein